MVALLLGACAPAGPRAALPPPPTTPAAATDAPPIAAPAPTPDAPASPETVVGALLGSTRADFDCDTWLDELRFFELPRPVGSRIASPNLGKLARLTLASGPSHELAFEGLPLGEGADSPLIGVADVNGDTCADAIVTVGHGASTTWTAFLVFDGTRLVEAEEDGKPAVFLYEGSVRHGAGIECRRTSGGEAEIVYRSVSNYISEFQWDLVERVYRWPTPSTLALFATTKAVIPVPVAYEEPPDPGRYWGLSCGSLQMPPWAFTR